MSKRTHEQQRARARQKRESDRLAARKKRSQVVVITMVVLLVLSLVGATLVGLAGGDPSPSVDDLEEELADLDAQAGPPEDLEPCAPSGDTPEPREVTFDEPPLVEVPDETTVTARLVTTCGDVVVELLPAVAPVAVGNFVGLTEAGFYAGVGFHRTQWDFVIQGGDPAGDGTGGPGYEIEDELDLPQTFEPFGDQLVGYPRGIVAMANRGPDTAGSQFFIVQADPDYPFPPLYTVFGRVVEGMDVVDRIAAGEEVGSIAVDPVVILDVVIEGLPAGAGAEDDDADDDADDADDADPDDVDD